MRLINVQTLELRQFQPADLPLYAIISHRWGPDELQYEDYLNPVKHHGAGYAKVRNACHAVQSYYWTFERKTPRGRVRTHTSELVDWIWIDTCCIDKRNFTEYTEAINSMWEWYKRAAFCLVYLADTPFFDDRNRTLAGLRRSEWFERGWTLQELLAPRSLFFYSTEWHYIGSSGEADLMESVARASTIPRKYLGNRAIRLTDLSIAKRMSWASARKTTVPEDIAYCLLGVFDVNMYLMYGEGPHKAFRRLQETILHQYDDESIFAFTPATGEDGALATSPRDFATCGDVIRCRRQERPAYFLTNRGLQFNSPAIDMTGDYSTGTPRHRYAIELNCARSPRGSARPALCTLGLRKKGSRFIRDTEVEDRFDSTSKARVEEKLNRGIWRWSRTRKFDIHTSKSGRSRHRREIAEEPRGVSDVFSKARDWLAAHCPFKRYIFPSSRNGVGKEIHSHQEKRSGYSNPPSKRHRTGRPDKRSSLDTRDRRARHRHKGQSNQAPSSRVRHESDRRSRSKVRSPPPGRQRPRTRTRDLSVGSPGDSSWPLRPQWIENHGSHHRRASKASDRPRQYDEQYRYPDSRHRGARSLRRSSKPPRRSDSGYASNHSRAYGGLHRAGPGDDSDSDSLFL